jgi:hypothetical protein
MQNVNNDGSEHNDFHDNQSSISSDLCIILTRAFNRRDEAAEGMAEWIEAIGRGKQCGARGPFRRIGEKPRDAVKGATDWEGRHRAFEPLMIG